MSQKYVIVHRVEMKRIIFHLEGELVGFEGQERPKIRFVTDNELYSYAPQHLTFEGNKFKLTMNMLSVNNEHPMEQGEYYLMAVTKKKRKYGAILREGLEEKFDHEPENKRNLVIHRNGGHYFYAYPSLDLDTNEFYLDVRSKIPARPQFYMKANFKKWVKKKKLHFHETKGYIFVSLYGFFSKHAHRKGNKILFCSGSRAEIGGNEEFIYKRMIERGLDKKFKFRFDFKESIDMKRGAIKKIRFARLLATSDFILIDDYYPDIYQLDYPDDVQVVQVWHACGAFKALGLERMDKPGAPPLNTRVHKCYTAMPVSSDHSLLHHAEAFGISEKKFYPIGIPRTDIFFDEEYKKERIQFLQDTYPQIKTADKVYMYAPTFRGDNALNAYFPFNKLDFEKWGAMLEETNSVLLVRMHPFVHDKIEIPEEYKDRIVDASEYREGNDLLFGVDVLITDYSSIIYEFSLLRRPMYFYAFDQRMYVATRDFYEPYEDIVPGQIVKKFDDLLDVLRKGEYSEEQMDAFVKKNFKYTDGKATDRFIDQIILGEKEEETK